MIPSTPGICVSCNRPLEDASPSDDHVDVVNQVDDPPNQAETDSVPSQPKPIPTGIQTCAHCETTVLPSSDGACPACRKLLNDPVEVAIDSNLETASGHQADRQGFKSWLTTPLFVLLGVIAGIVVGLILIGRTRYDNFDDNVAYVDFVFIPLFMIPFGAILGWLLPKVIVHGSNYRARWKRQTQADKYRLSVVGWAGVAIYVGSVFLAVMLERLGLPKNCSFAIQQIGFWSMVATAIWMDHKLQDR